MIRSLKPTWDDLRTLVSDAEERLWLCSPYIKDEALGKVADALASRDKPLGVRIWTRLSPSDWATGASDPDSLVSFMSLLMESGHEADLGIVQRLHAKVFAADETAAIVGSANLSSGGFQWNLELAVRIEGTPVIDALRLLEEGGQRRLRVLDLDGLSGWVAKYEQDVQKAKASEGDEAIGLADAQAALDSLLGFGKGSDGEIREPSSDDLDAFASWLRGNDGLAGAKVILRRHTNADSQNLMGHVKQSFAGWWRFLSTAPDLVDVLSEVLDSLAADEIYAMDDGSIVDTWTDFFDSHATDVGDFFSFPTLRGVLPPSVGGTREGGGGGISTFKRVGPLLARFMVEREGA